MTTLAAGVIHSVPVDMRRALLQSGKVSTAWNSLTPLARNEWICWTTSVKRSETRAAHIERLVYDITHGKRRPCCWPGCSHRSKVQASIKSRK
ncbi:YdeI/OmpD-associated family protein [Patescibacteria group bacterium]|nr:YdeI/OmpD-associated family protein [Patescibacteria group bacterium]